MHDTPAPFAQSVHGGQAFRCVYIKFVKKGFTDEKRQDVNNMKIALASQPTLDDSIALNVNRIEKALASLRKKLTLLRSEKVIFRALTA